MSTVYIIGNGFDLNLGLKTSYKDFLKSDFFLQYLGPENKLFNFLHNVHEESKWIDIEKELEKFSKQNDGYNYFLREYKELCSALKAYMKSIDTKSIDRKSEAYRLFSSEHLRGQITIINFNYTNSVLNIIKSLGYTKNEIDMQIMHIHGSIDIDEIIFGVDDKARIDDSHTFLYKSVSSIYNGKKCASALRDFEKLYIFGHSLGESDHMYFDFFRSLSTYPDNDKEVNIYHYGEEDKYRIFKQLQRLTGNEVSKLKNHATLNIIDVKE